MPKKLTLTLVTPRGVRDVTVLRASKSSLIDIEAREHGTPEIITYGEVRTWQQALQAVAGYGTCSLKSDMSALAVAIHAAMTGVEK